MSVTSIRSETYRSRQIPCKQELFAGGYRMTAVTDLQMSGTHQVAVSQGCTSVWFCLYHAISH